MTSATTPGALHTPLGAESIRWTTGFWKDVVETTRTRTVPSIWASLSTPSVSPGWQNFRIAAGEITGTHDGPPFLDGDTYKWLEAAVSLLETQPDPESEALIERLASTIASVQREDGYLHTPTIISALNNEGVVELADRFNFETYNLGHLITLAIRHHRVTGSRTLLDAAEKAAGFLETLAYERPDDLARSAICPSHYMAVVELYTYTGNERYLRLSKAFLEVRDNFAGGDDNQDRLPVHEQTEIVGHAVRANYLYAGLADLVAVTDDTPLRDVLEGLWSDAVDTKMSIVGGCGALYDGASPEGAQDQSQISRVHQAYGRRYQMPHTTAHNESCANIGMVLWSDRMLRLTGEAKYADLIERIMYNVMLASISLDREHYFYTNPLRRVRDLPIALRMPGDTAIRPIPTPPPSDKRTRDRYMSCFCCPPNIARTLAQVHERVAMVSADGIRLNLYGGAEVNAVHDGQGLSLSVETNYPWDETITVRVTEVHGEGLPVKLRIPGWCAEATLTLNGAAVPVNVRGDYVSVQRDWAVGDELVLTLSMPVRVHRGHRLAEELTGQVAVARGPVVYCVESVDLPEGTRLEQIALRRSATFETAPATIDGHDVIAVYADAVVLPVENNNELFPEVESAPLTDARVRLVPYYTWDNRGTGEMSVWLPVVW